MPEKETPEQWEKDWEQEEEDEKSDKYNDPNLPDEEICPERDSEELP